MENATIWIQSGDETIYPQRGAAENYVTLHYRRPAGDYGDYASTDYADFWGLHAWGDAPDPGWTTPHKPMSGSMVLSDTFGVTFKLDLTTEDPQQMGYLFHRGDDKDPGPDQFLEFGTSGFEVWQLQGADPENPYVLPILGEAGPDLGNIGEQQAYWVNQDTIAWAAADSGLGLGASEGG